MHQAPVASSAPAEDAFSWRSLRQTARRIWRTGDIPVLSERPIGWRFYALSALGLMSLLAFALSYGIGEWRISSAAHDQAEFGEMRDRAADFRADLLALQTGLAAQADEQEPGAATQMKATLERIGATSAKMRTPSVAREEKETL